MDTGGRLGLGFLLMQAGARRRDQGPTEAAFGTVAGSNQARQEES
ncbi:hypothetical protein [Corynebacterium casei]|nr:hypothetical protein [Corynebacterium casei]